MPMYLARLTSDKQLVGFFSVEDDSELFWLIDQCCDPYQVEIAELGTGGLYWSKSIEYVVPIPNDEHDEPVHDSLPPDPSLSGEWSSAIFGEDALTWRPVPVELDLDD